MNKKCTKCHITKHADFFYRNKAKKDGRQSHCKECHNKVTIKWRKANPDKYSIHNCTPRRNKEMKLKSKLRSKTNRRNLTDSYIRDLITMNNTSLKPKDIPQKLVDAYRIQVKLKRILGLTAIKQ
tara:strand:- start:123 stop:497 length:375 start_codon:yes stop_codon:yes gene_type:complete